MSNPNEDYLHLTFRERAPRPGDTVTVLCGYQWTQQPEMSFAQALDAAQVHEALQPLPPQARGAMFHNPEFRKLCKRVGVTVSPYTGGYVGEWERVDNAA